MLNIMRLTAIVIGIVVGGLMIASKVAAQESEPVIENNSIGISK